MADQQQFDQTQSQQPEHGDSSHIALSGADDPALAAQMRQEAEAAADAGAAQALAEAQAASAAAQAAERDAADQEQETERQSYDLGQEFAQYAPQDQQQQQQQQAGGSDPSGRTFLTGVDNASQANLQQAQQQQQQHQQQADHQSADANGGRMSDEELMYDTHDTSQQRKQDVLARREFESRDARLSEPARFSPHLCSIATVPCPFRTAAATWSDR